MNKFILGILLTFSLAQTCFAWPQGYGWLQDTAILPGGTTLPSNCQAKQTFIKTDASNGQQLYLCIAGTWVAQGSGGGGGTPGGSNTQVQYNSSGSFAANSGFVYNGTNVGIGTSDLSNATLNVGGTMLINGGGNVGIGTLHPRQLLEVAGTVQSTNVIDTGVTASSLVWNNGSQQLAPVTLTTTGSSGPSTFLSGTLNIPQYSGGGSGLWTTINTNDVYEINSGTYGNVGIGTSATTNASFKILKNGSTDYVRVNSVAAAGGDVFLIQNNGNVGIGSVTPGQVLDVNGTVRLNNLFVPGNIGIGTTSTTTQLSINGSINTFGSSGNTTLNATGGNVGIGSTNPGVALDVQGTVRISTGTAGQAVCWKSDKSLGQCTTVVGAGGACTCS